MRTSGIPERPRVGLGGEGVLRSTGREAGATAVITEALDRGVRYFDSARAYGDSELYHGTIWGGRPGRRDGIFLTSKSGSRSYAGAMADLTQTLARMQTDYLDLWQIHDLRTRPEAPRDRGAQWGAPRLSRGEGGGARQADRGDGPP